MIIRLVEASEDFNEFDDFPRLNQLVFLKTLDEFEDS